jgi:hypothetical protein
MFSSRHARLCLCSAVALAPQSFPTHVFSSKLFRIRIYEKHARKPFRMRSFKTQDLKPFRMSIYRKTGWGPDLAIAITVRQKEGTMNRPYKDDTGRGGGSSVRKPFACRATWAGRGEASTGS